MCESNLWVTPALDQFSFLLEAARSPGFTGSVILDRTLGACECYAAQTDALLGRVRMFLAGSVTSAQTANGAWLWWAAVLP